MKVWTIRQDLSLVEHEPEDAANADAFLRCRLGYPTRLEAAYAAYDRARQEMCDAQNKVAKAWDQFTKERDANQ